MIRPEHRSPVPEMGHHGRPLSSFEGIRCCGVSFSGALLCCVPVSHPSAAEQLAPLAFAEWQVDSCEWGIKSD